GLCAREAEGRAVQVYLGILRGGEKENDPERAEVSAQARPSASRAQSPLTSFVGRDEDLPRVLKNLRAARLVTLTGPGGVGKTRLAIEASGRLGAAAWFVPLAPVTDPAEVAYTVLDVLGIREPVIARRAAEPGTGPLDRLAAALGDREDVLILDNCEHVIEAAAGLAGHVLAACPRLRILATSRQPLRIDGETLCPVPPLPIPPAPAAPVTIASYGSVRLLRDRAVAVRPDFELGEANAAAVARICRALDGMPLAIELAAVWLRTLTPAQLAERLDDRFALLTGEAGRRCPGIGRSGRWSTGAGTCCRRPSRCWRAGWLFFPAGPRWPPPSTSVPTSCYRRPRCCPRCPAWSTSRSWARPRGKTACPRGTGCWRPSAPTAWSGWPRRGRKPRCEARSPR